MKYLRKFMNINYIQTIILKALPRSLRYRVVRAGIKINFQPDKRLTFKLATTKEELSAAFKLLHDAYVGEGYMKPHPSGMRITIYHALPGTSTLIALFDNKVIGTVSIIRRTGMGLPLETIFNTSHVVKNSIKCAEISALATHKDFRKQRGEILFPLLKFLYEYCTKYFGIDLMLIAVNPKGIDYYKALLSFKDLQSKEVSNYSYVNGAPAAGAYLFLDDAYKELNFLFNHKKNEKNLFKFFLEVNLPNFHFPERKYHTTCDPVMSPELLRYFFIEQSTIFNFLTKKEYITLKKLYNHKQYSDILPEYRLNPQVTGQRLTRYAVNCPGVLYVDDQKNIRMKVVNVSKNGLGAFIDEAVILSNHIKAKIEIAEFEIIDLKLKPVWKDDEKTYYGFALLEDNLEWSNFLQYIEKRFLMMNTATFRTYRNIA